MARLEENAGLVAELAIEQQPESVISPPVSVKVTPPPPPNSSSAQPDPSWSDDSERPGPTGGTHRVFSDRSNESSAWIPAVRPKRDE
jgi:hypothetical protein